MNELSDKILRLIESNRQTGITSSLIKLIRETGGILIVGTQDTKNRLITENLDLKNRIFGIFDSDMLRGTSVQRIYFDTDAVQGIIRMLTPKVEDKNSNTYSFDNQLNITTNSKGHGTIVLNEEEITLKGKSVILNGNEFVISDQEPDKSSPKAQQLNIKLTQQDTNDMDEVNEHFFEGEASNSMLGRILLRKGIQFYRKLREQI